MNTRAFHQLSNTQLHNIMASGIENTWPIARNMTLRCMSKLLNKEQAVNLMVNTMAKYGFSKSDVVSKEYWRPIVTEVFDYVQNRNKRAAILSEIEKYLV